MRRPVAVLLAAGLVAAPPTTAYAQDDFGTALGFVLLFTLDTVATIGGTVTGIGSAVQLQRDPPKLGWSIASIVVGSLAGVIGAITIAALVGSGIDDDEGTTLWTFAIVPMLVCAANLSIGIVNLNRWGTARKEAPDEEEEYEEVDEEEWSGGPAPGVGISVRF